MLNIIISSFVTAVTIIMIESYFSGNPVCQSDKDLNCKRLCTDYCWSEKGFTNGGCDVTCDSRECKYDGGECKI